MHELDFDGTLTSVRQYQGTVRRFASSDSHQRVQLLRDEMLSSSTTVTIWSQHIRWLQILFQIELHGCIVCVCPATLRVLNGIALKWFSFQKRQDQIDHLRHQIHVGIYNCKLQLSLLHCLFWVRCRRMLRFQCLSFRSCLWFFAASTQLYCLLFACRSVGSASCDEAALPTKREGADSSYWWPLSAVLTEFHILTRSVVHVIPGKI